MRVLRRHQVILVTTFLDHDEVRRANMIPAVVLIVVMLATNSERSKQWLAVIKSRLSREEKGEAER